MTVLELLLPKGPDTFCWYMNWFPCGIAVGPEPGAYPPRGTGAPLLPAMLAMLWPGLLPLRGAASERLLDG